MIVTYSYCRSPSKSKATSSSPINDCIHSCYSFQVVHPPCCHHKHRKSSQKTPSSNPSRRNRTHVEPTY